jgi:hypothetical protein
MKQRWRKQLADTDEEEQEGKQREFEEGCTG